ncbi:MAG: DUF1501 domain-containing protein [Pirellulaceae bacterium]|jgi:hypothetical protein|nr:DUF1501 domain-containing protein [Pirellulaceae bacterium]MDP7016738.1 DUF1501 domain-containing protein [Pirellulaceae bacterium]
MPHNSNHPSRSDRPNRRRFLEFSTAGLAAAALIDLDSDAALGQTKGGPAFAVPGGPRVKRAVHISLIGGLSHVDSFDYKPALNKLHGKPIPDSVKPDTFFGSAGMMRQSEWKFRRRGASGLWVSDLFPHLASVADELTVINSMFSETANHTPATFVQNTGFQSNGFPSLGSWLSYGLGTESDSLPAYVVAPDTRSLPSSGASNWSSGFLPARHQGTIFRSGPQPIRDLFPAEPTSPRAETAARQLLAKLNRSHHARFGENDLLAARIRAYELAARMQTSVPESVKFADETTATHELYGLENPETVDCGRRCLLTRRLLERGVRFIQLFSGGAFGGKPRHGWDGHENNARNHGREAKMIDQPVAALIKDLKQRGMLDDTLILFTTEFGRSPFTHAPPKVLGLGRDHNPEGFSAWLAGGGLRKGVAYGATDEVGWRSVENRVSWHDFHATVLHLLGIDHERLTFYHNGIERRLTNVHGNVLKAILM